MAEIDDRQTPVFEYSPDSSAGSFVMLMAREGHTTVDGRRFARGSINVRHFPIPLMMTTVNDKGHKGSEAVGNIVEAWKDGDSWYGRGYFSSAEEGQRARKLISEGTISGVSVDVGGAVAEEFDVSEEDFSEGETPLRKLITKGTILMVTALPAPSFNDTKIAVEAEPIVAAAGAPWRPSRSFFENPRLDGPTALTVTEDGRVFGHAALWGTCHIGRPTCTTPPRSRSNYQYFNVGSVLTEEGDTVHVGRVTADIGHAPLEFSATAAVAHYDNSSLVAAYVQAGEDEHGIWVSGAVAPTATEEQVAKLRAASVSGDWRNIQGSLEMVGLLAVNVPGFPVPRASAGLVAGAQVSLVAAGVMSEKKKKKGCGCGCGDCGGEDMTAIEAEESSVEQDVHEDVSDSNEGQEPTEDLNASEPDSEKIEEATVFIVHVDDDLDVELAMGDIELFSV